MNISTGGYQNDAQRQRMATQQVCGVQPEKPNQWENPHQQDGGQRLTEPPRGTKKQLVGTIVGIVAVVLLLTLKAFNVF